MIMLTNEEFEASIIQAWGALYQQGAWGYENGEGHYCTSTGCFCVTGFWLLNQGVPGEDLEDTDSSKEVGCLPHTRRQVVFATANLHDIAAEHDLTSNGMLGSLVWATTQACPFYINKDAWVKACELALRGFK